MAVTCCQEPFTWIEHGRVVQRHTLVKARNLRDPERQGPRTYYVVHASCRRTPRPECQRHNLPWAMNLPDLRSPSPGHGSRQRQAPTEPRSAPAGNVLQTPQQSGKFNRELFHKLATKRPGGSHGRRWVRL